MVAFIILSFLFVFLLGLIIVPLTVTINTLDEVYRVRIWGYFSAKLHMQASEFLIKMRVIGIPITMNPLKISRKSKAPKKSKPRKKRKRKTASISQMSMVAGKLVRTIEIERLHAAIDTGDFPLNAQLVPFCSMINKEYVSVSVNFTNTNYLDLQLRTKLIRILYILIKFNLFTKNKNHGN